MTKNSVRRPTTWSRTGTSSRESFRIGCARVGRAPSSVSVSWPANGSRSGTSTGTVTGFDERYDRRRAGRLPSQEGVMSDEINDAGASPSGPPAARAAAEQDLKATADSIRADAGRLATIE